MRHSVYSLFRASSPSPWPPTLPSLPVYIPSPSSRAPPLAACTHRDPQLSPLPPAPPGRTRPSRCETLLLSGLQPWALGDHCSSLLLPHQGTGRETPGRPNPRRRAAGRQKSPLAGVAVRATKPRVCSRQSSAAASRKGQAQPGQDPRTGDRQRTRTLCQHEVILSPDCEARELGERLSGCCCRAKLDHFESTLELDGKIQSLSCQLHPVSGINACFSCALQPQASVPRAPSPRGAAPAMGARRGRSASESLDPVRMARLETSPEAPACVWFVFPRRWVKRSSPGSRCGESKGTQGAGSSTSRRVSECSSPWGDF